MFRIFREIELDEKIVVAADTGNGGGDRCAAQFLSLTHNDVPMVYHTPGITPDMTDVLAPALEEIARITNYKPLVTYELNNGGFNELTRLNALNRSNLWDMWHPRDKEGKEMDNIGWTTTEQARKAMLVDLKDALDNRLIKVYDPETVKELLSFVNIQKPGGGWKPQAESGAHDDLVMALAIAWQLYMTPHMFMRVHGSDTQARVFTGGDSITGYGGAFQRSGEGVRTFI
jgi:hypothetical protein